jgi:hypothetical protein
LSKQPSRSSPSPSPPPPSPPSSDSLVSISPPLLRGSLQKGSSSFFEWPLRDVSVAHGVLSYSKQVKGATTFVDIPLNGRCINGPPPSAAAYPFIAMLLLTSSPNCSQTHPSAATWERLLK